MALALLAAGVPQAVVLEPVANMYSKPTEDSDVVSQAIYASPVSIIGEQPGWFHVRTPDDYTGWMPAGDARRVEKPYGSAGKMARVESLFANIYREPDVTKHAPRITVPFETRLVVFSVPSGDDRWLEVRLPDDRLGWLQQGDVSFDEKPLSIDAVIALSRRFLGLPYTWGGTSTFGYDCSGFVQMLCRRRGVVTPRDADQQAAWSGVVPVGREELEPGDLLFFGSAPDHITHTGMYIGRHEFINATTWSHPVVQICDLRDPHWTRLLVACRRLK